MVETPPVTKSGSPEKPSGTTMEEAFWKYAELYTGMQGIDMKKSSHGRAFMAGWDAAGGKSAEFCTWLKGFADITDCSAPNGDQWLRICERLNEI